jgi:hypothetical protein
MQSYDDEVLHITYWEGGWWSTDDAGSKMEHNFFEKRKNIHGMFGNLFVGMCPRTAFAPNATIRRWTGR